MIHITDTKNDKGFKKFNFSSLDELRNEAGRLGLDMRFSDDTSILKEKLIIQGGHILHNRMAYHPMEGCDGTVNGAPDELTIRRYERFAAGGAGLLWFEAVAVVPEGRANPRHLWINDENVDDFKRLIKRIRAVSSDIFGNEFRQLIIMQLTNAGRYSKPNGFPEPLMTYHNEILDKAHGTDPGIQTVTDEYLMSLPDKYAKAAELACEAGFDGVDIKACHRYLISELLSAYDRPGIFGGDFSGRTRLLTETVRKVRKTCGNDFIVATRLNAFDGLPRKLGFGAHRDGKWALCPPPWPEDYNVDNPNYLKYDTEEPAMLAKLLSRENESILNITMGNPYYNPHVNRPYDKGFYIPAENPLIGVARMTLGAGEIKKAVPEMVVIGTGYTWLREYAANYGAACIEDGLVDVIGFGRQAFAYPDFAADILKSGSMKREKCCITCGKCTEIMRCGGTAGCVIRDRDVYLPVYNHYCNKK